jgi:hypothetical protein
VSARVALAQAQARARRRALAIALLRWAPWLGPTILAALRWGGAAWALPVLPLLAGAVAVARAWARHDADWMAMRLDATRADFDDSAALLYADPATLSPVARLQQLRLEARVRALALPDLRAPWPRAALATLVGAALLAGLVAWWPASVAAPTAAGDRASPTAPRAASPLRLRAAALRIAPPPYTGLPARTTQALAATVPEGATLDWSLQLSGAAERVVLGFHDGATLALRRDGDAWRGARVVPRATLYRVLVDDRVLGARWNRIAVQRDQPPRLRVLRPERSLTLLGAGQPSWDFVLEASDDHGLGAAQLTLTLAQGSGENIQVSTRTLALFGSGDARARRYTRRLDLRALGFAAGDDLVLRASVRDRRSPSPQTARSASFILRWPPPPSAEASGVEGLVTRTLPAYFRSQRQIIIDTEALLAERRKLSADAYMTRSDAIGVDQRILRLRYGQFLGEEAVSGRQGPVAGPTPAPTPTPSVVAPDPADRAATTTASIPDATSTATPTAGASPTAEGVATPATATAPPADAHDDQADEATGDGASSAGNAAAVVAQFGHTHDESEAATLLDPDTRALLKQALDAMWLAEGELRTGHPDRARPHEYRALRLVKQVQQSSRIYLARVGLALPPVDEARRLTGKREGIASARDPLAPSTRIGSPLLALWQALEPGADPGARAGAERGFAAWLRENEERDDALALFAAFDAWRAEPRCARCVAELRRRLWPLLPARPAALPARVAPDAQGRAYLDALQAAERPERAR